MSKRIIAADLFCGAGGSSTGLSRAAEALGYRVNLIAVNHWDRAIETHSANHPKAAHFCQSLADLDPRKAVPGGRLDLLVASPECTHHSVARGGKPVNDQSRSSAYCVHRWCAALDVRRVLIENVPEFTTWGPLGANDKPLASAKGKLFAAYIETFRAMGYRVEYRVLNSADFGAATSRRRLFIQCVKGRLPISWPERTHEPEPKEGLFGTLAKWRGATEIIDWNLKGESIFSRKRPLSQNTLNRIAAGLRKFGGVNAEPFLVMLRGTAGSQIDNSARSTSQPAPTLTTSGGHIALCEPFVMRASNGGDDNCRVKSPDVPLGTIHAGGGSFGIVEPFVMHTTHHGADRVYSPSNPLPCVTGSNRGEQAIVQPFILPHRQFDGMQVDDIAKPIRTITATNGRLNAVVQPFILPPEGVFRGNTARSTADPTQTITAGRGGGHLVEATAQYDILFRMLQPHELAAAMGFPKDYRIAGNRGEQTKQIGNAVEVNQAEALCRAMLDAA